eukprot:scaffold17923_cov147-Skeletonema_menzelii.AAC.2
MNNIVKNVGTALHISKPDNQHPSAAGEGGQKSNRISIDVEESYKVFNEFQLNLKHLATLYKTEHELMKSLNENGIYTAKCYQKMLANSPLEHVVANSTMEEGDPPNNKLPDKKIEDPESIAESAAIGVSKSGSADDNAQESTRKMDPEEVLEEQDYIFSKKDSRSSHVANSKNRDAVVTQGAKKVSPADPPSKESLLKKAMEEDQKGDTADDEPESDDLAPKEDEVVEEPMSDGPPSDPPSESDYPNDEQPGDEVDNDNDNFQSEGVNVMMGVIDDDDSFTHEVIDDDDSFVNDNTPNVDEAKLDTIDDDSIDVDKETKNKLTKRRAVDPDGEVMEPQEEDSTNVELNENNNDNEPGLAPAAEDKKDSEAEGNDEAGEELHDVELAEKVEPSAPELDKSEKLTSFGGLCEASYFDVHKQVYKETNSYLKKHLKLVDYAEDWEKTVTTRVQSMHVEYQKLRKGLNHYIGKVDALENEKKKAEEKQREMAPKRLEKLERNRTKLMGTRKSHDVAGIDLIIYIDEIVNRSWRDAYPLLQKSVTFDTDISSMQAKMYGDLKSAATMLDQASRKETISSSHRLLQLKNSSPEELNFYKFRGDWDTKA